MWWSSLIPGLGNSVFAKLPNIGSIFSRPCRSGSSRLSFADHLKPLPFFGSFVTGGHFNSLSLFSGSSSSLEQPKEITVCIPHLSNEKLPYLPANRLQPPQQSFLSPCARDLATVAAPPAQSRLDQADILLNYLRTVAVYLAR